MDRANIVKRLVAEESLFQEATKAPFDSKEFLKFLADNPNFGSDSIQRWADEHSVSVDELASLTRKLASQMAQFWTQGRANEKGVTEKDVDPHELAMGIKVEAEHTDNKEVAKRIALDHLAEEISDYYTRLYKMEKDAGIDEYDDRGKDSILQTLHGVR